MRSPLFGFHDCFPKICFKNGRCVQCNQAELIICQGPFRDTVLGTLSMQLRYWRQ